MIFSTCERNFSLKKSYTFVYTLNSFFRVKIYKFLNSGAQNIAMVKQILIIVCLA